MGKLRQMTKQEDADRKLMLSKIRALRTKGEEGTAHRMMADYRRTYWENPNPPKGRGSKKWGAKKTDSSKRKARRRRRRRSD